MGILSKDKAVEIKVEYPDLYEELKELGYDIYESFDTEALHRMMEIFEEMGLKEEADLAYTYMIISEEYWAERVYIETNAVIAYDPRVKRWRDMITGKFVKDPYESLWD